MCYPPAKYHPGTATGSFIDATNDNRSSNTATRNTLCHWPEDSIAGAIHVDDDSDVRLKTQIALENDGVAVIIAANALEGLILFAKHITAQYTHMNSARIDTAAIDLRMPGMHGPELADLREQINSQFEGAMTKTTD